MTTSSWTRFGWKATKEVQMIHELIYRILYLALDWLISAESIKARSGLNKNIEEKLFPVVLMDNCQFFGNVEAVEMACGWIEKLISISFIIKGKTFSSNECPGQGLFEITKVHKRKLHGVRRKSRKRLRVHMAKSVGKRITFTRDVRIPYLLRNG